MVRSVAGRLAGGVLLAIATLAPPTRARAEDAPPPAPPSPAPAPAAPEPDAPAPRGRPPAPVDPARYRGIRWERDFDAGLARAAAEGRGAYFCVNALVDQGENGNVFLARAYQGADLGIATRGLVCFVCNDTSHETVTVRGEPTCARYGCGTCAAHQAASAWLAAHATVSISPAHFVFDPDGALVYAVDYMQGALGAADAEAWFVRLSPRQALRDVWSSREQRTDALAKASPADLQATAVAWLATKDPMAVVGVAATLEQETDALRREALFAALATAGPAAVPAIWDAVDGAATDPDVDPAATRAWMATALRCAPTFGAWAIARAVVRTKEATLARDLLGLGAALDAAAQTPQALALLEEARVASGATTDDAKLVGLAAAAAWPSARLDAARARLGKQAPMNLLTATRDEVRRGLLALTPNAAKAARAKLRPYLDDPVEELRVAAAVALRRGGDAAGAEILLAALADPVEGPEVRWALTKLVGQDRGDSAQAWEDVVRAGEDK